MRNLTLLATLAAATPGLALAQPATGGFTGPDATRTVTTAEAAGLADDTPVRLVGFIQKSLGDERYEFRDEAGTLTVEIGAEDWAGVEATPETRVELRGEIDKEFTRTEVDVDAVRAAP